MPASEILRRLQLLKARPDIAKELTPTELAELVVVVLEYVKEVTEAIEAGKVVGPKGDDGYTPKADKDYLALPTAQEKIDAAVARMKADVQARLDSIRDGKDGEDALVTNAHIEQAAAIAAGLIQLPDFAALITKEPEAIRDALELLQGDERLKHTAISGLTEVLDELSSRINKTAVIGRNTVTRTQMSVVTDALGIKLKGDEEAPGNAKYYGTDGSGNAGYHDLPTGGVVAFADLTGSPNDNAALDSALDAKSDVGHTHDDRYYTETETNTLLASKANSLGTDDNYVTDAEKAKIGFISVTQAVDLDTMESDIATKQPLDSDLTSIAAMTPTNDDIIQRKAGAWTNRTPAQVKTDLALAKGDVGLGNVDNTSDVNKPISTATQIALDAKQPLDADLTTIAGLTSTTDSFMQAKGSAWAARTIAQVKTDLGLSGTNTGDQTSVTGNAGTATALQTARLINGVSFNGTADIKVSSPLHVALVAHFPLDFATTSGTTAYDMAGARNNGTATGPTFLPTSGPDSNGAWDFDGVDDYIEIPHHANQLLVNALSISAWIAADTAGETAGRILDKSTGTSGQTGFTYDTFSNRLEFKVNNGAGPLSASNSIPYDGTWHHCVVTVTAAGVTNFYVDGVLSGAANQAGTALSGITGTGVMRIGNRSGGTDRTFDGKIAKLRVYSRVLTTAEVSELYTNQL
jgi:hypothetical protein